MKVVKTCASKVHDRQGRTLRNDLSRIQDLIVKHISKITELQLQTEETEIALMQTFKTEKQILMQLQDNLQNINKNERKDNT